MLNEYHKFNYKDKYFILHVEDMKAYCVNKALYDETEKIEKNNFNNGGIIGNELTGALEKLNIIKNTSNTVKDKSNKEIEFILVTHISLNVTQSCNLACIYCYGGDGEYDGYHYRNINTGRLNE